MEEKTKVIENIISKRGYFCERCKCILEGSGGNIGNPRYRQLHHKKQKKDQGAYTEENLELLCLKCHRKEHKNEHKK